METFAQKRSRLNKLREIVNKPVGAVKKMFDPEFEPLWEKMGQVDEQIREEAQNLKEYVKVAKTNFNRREYMTAIRFLGSFHDQIEKIDKQLSDLLTSVDVKHHEFLFGDLDPEDLKYLTEQLGPKFEKKSPTQKRVFIEKEAGITDWWHNISTDRGRQLAAWEKRFSKDAKELKRQTATLINKSEQLYNLVISTFKQFATYYATRKVEDYLKLAEKLRQKFKAYTSAFDSYYNNYVKKYIEIQKAMQTLPDVTPSEEEIPKGSSNINEPSSSGDITSDSKLPSFSPSIPSGILSEIPSTLPSEHPKFPKPISEIPSTEKSIEEITEKESPEAYLVRKKEEPAFESPAVTAPTVFAPVNITNKTPGGTFVSPGSMPRGTVPYKSPGVADVPFDLANPAIPKAPKTPNIRYDEPTAQEAARFIQYKPDQSTKETVAPPSSKKSASHKEFLEGLMKLSSSNPIIIAVHIAKYAKSIEKIDSEMSKKLTMLAQNVLKGN